MTSERLRATEEPAIIAVCVTNAKTHLARTARLQQRLSLEQLHGGCAVGGERHDLHRVPDVSAVGPLKRTPVLLVGGQRIPVQVRRRCAGSLSERCDWCRDHCGDQHEPAELRGLSAGLAIQECSMNPNGVHSRQTPIHRKMLNLKKLHEYHSDKIWTMVDC